MNAVRNMADSANKLYEVALRIREMREIAGFTPEEMAQKTEVPVSAYLEYEGGSIDLPFTFIHKCALAFGVEMTDLLEGQSAHLSSYAVTRKGGGHSAAKEPGIDIRNLAPLFRNKLAEPYWVRYEYSADQQNRPIHLTKHSGQEFDLILNGSLKVQIGSNIEVLHEGDSIYYDSGTPHGMIAVDGADCLFLAVVVNGAPTEEKYIRESVALANTSEKLVCENFVKTTLDENGVLSKIDFENEEKFNFAYDVVDALADREPEKLAMLHIDRDKNERRLTFKDMKRASGAVCELFQIARHPARRPRHARAQTPLSILVCDSRPAQAGRRCDPRDQSAAGT